jgi:hypothetical protein
VVQGVECLPSMCKAMSSKLHPILQKEKNLELKRTITKMKMSLKDLKTALGRQKKSVNLKIGQQKLSRLSHRKKEKNKM